MNAQVTHTPGPLKVYFGGQTCSLYFDKKGDERAKDRLMQLPRDHSLGDADPNVMFVRTLAAAPELLEALREALNQMDTLQAEHTGRWSNEKTNMLSAARHQARAAIARATGAKP